MDSSRRMFLQSSLSAALISANWLQVSHGQNTKPPGHTHQAQPRRPFYDTTTKYSPDDLFRLYQKRSMYGEHSYLAAQEKAAATPLATDSVLFYWDPTTNLLTNPYNLKADTTFTSSKTYTINAEVLNFHPSSNVDQNVLASLDTNLQLVFQTQNVDSSGDLLTSITMAGLQFADNYLSGTDSKLLPLTSNNQLTSFPPAEQIDIVDGQISMKVSLAGQKRASFWDKLLQIFQSFTNSPVFGLLPIPKLYSTAAQTVTTLLNQVEQEQRLIPLLNGKILDFRLYDGGSTNPFVMKPGFWVVMNAEEAAPHIDSTSHNITDLQVDIPDQLYEMKDKSGNAVDITYCVSRILIPTVQSS